MRLVILKVRNLLLCTVLRWPLYIIARAPGLWDWPTWLNKPWTEHTDLKVLIWPQKWFSISRRSYCGERRCSTHHPSSDALQQCLARRQLIISIWRLRSRGCQAGGVDIHSGSGMVRIQRVFKSQRLQDISNPQVKEQALSVSVLAVSVLGLFWGLFLVCFRSVLGLL